jgi:hypothetical protein
MHDFDRTQPELDESEPYLDESEPYGEYEFDVTELGFDGEYEFDATEAEMDELELATNLLEVTDETELEEFLGKLVAGMAGAARQAVTSPTGRAVVGVLRDAARTAVPRIGATLGSGVVPGKVGRQFGAAAGRRLVNWLGLELEGLSDEDAEFELARAFVRFGRDAGRRAFGGRISGPPATVAKKAAVAAARRQAPQLASVIARRPVRPAGFAPTSGPHPSGRWVRRNGVINLQGV